MSNRIVKIIVNGATGRLGSTQHLPALMGIRQDGGLLLANGDRLIPEPVLAGRNPEKLAALAARHGLSNWTTDVETTLADSANEIFFDAASTASRPALLRKALEAGKHVYAEKPLAHSLDQAVALVRLAARQGLTAGIVQDKLFLPGMLKLKLLKNLGFFGKILHARIEFGWWAFDGRLQPCQRPSWNYQRAGGGGLILDMFPHWRYLVDRLLAPIVGVSCRHATHIERRWDEVGTAYAVDVEDAAYGTFELEDRVLVELTSSWSTRARRDDLLQIHVDGINGSAVATIHDCYIQPAGATPRPIFDPDTRREFDYRADWQRVPNTFTAPSAYRRGWELFFAGFAAGTPLEFGFIEGAKGLQLIDAAYRSHTEKRWIELPRLIV
jgi:predicted dehydrogenase